MQNLSIEKLSSSIEPIRETVMSSIVSAALNGSVCRSKMQVYHSGEINNFDQMVPSEIITLFDGKDEEAEDATAEFVLGVGDALIALNMLAGPIASTKEVYESADKKDPTKAIEVPASRRKKILGSDLGKAIDTINAKAPTLKYGVDEFGQIVPSEESLDTRSKYFGNLNSSKDVNRG